MRVWVHCTTHPPTHLSTSRQHQTYNYGKTSYEKGNAYAQVAISTQVSARSAESPPTHGDLALVPMAQYRPRALPFIFGVPPTPHPSSLPCAPPSIFAPPPPPPPTLFLLSS